MFTLRVPQNEHLEGSPWILFGTVWLAVEPTTLQNATCKIIPTIPGIPGITRIPRILKIPRIPRNPMNLIKGVSGILES